MITPSPRFHFDRVDRRTKKVTPALIASITDRIVRRVRPEKVVLFGSQASGNGTPGSDIDLLIVLNNQHALASMKRRERFGQVLELFLYRSFGLDAFVLTQAEIEELREANEGEWDLVLEILEKGKVLYERAGEAETERTRAPAHARMVPQG